MCCILGIGWQRGNTIRNSKAMREVAKKLLVNGQTRGRDAAGMAFTTSKEITVVKHNVKADSLVKEEEFDTACSNLIAFSENDRKNTEYDPLISAIGHCRQKTKGTPEDYNNNHPIVSNKIVGVHNGMIGNDDKLFDKFKDLGMERRAEVDSEIIFRLIDHYADGGYDMEESIITTAKMLMGSYACAVVNAAHPYELWLFKGNGPLDIYHYKDVGMILFSSEKRYIEDAVDGTTLGQPTIIPLLPHQGIGIDLHQNTYKKFDLTYNSFNSTPNSEIHASDFFQ